MLQLEVILESLNDDLQISELFGFTQSMTSEMKNDDSASDDTATADEIPLRLISCETLMKMLLWNLGFFTVSSILYFVFTYLCNWQIMSHRSKDMHSFL